MPVPHTAQFPFIAGRVAPPFAGIATCCAFFISRLSLHFMQCAITGAPAVCDGSIIERLMNKLNVNKANVKDQIDYPQYSTYV